MAEETSWRNPSQPRGCTRTIAIDRGEFLQAMQRLDDFYRAPEGLRDQKGCRSSEAPDFRGSPRGSSMFYLNARLAGRSINAAWGEVVRGIEASDEWTQKHPDQASRVRFAVIGDYGSPASRPETSRSS